MGAQGDAQEKLFAQIAKVAEAAGDLDYGVGTCAEALRDLSFAYRLVAGGPQPGGVPVSSN